ESLILTIGIHLFNPKIAYMKNCNNAIFLVLYLSRTQYLKFLLFILFFGLLCSVPAQAEGILDKKITIVVQQKEVRSILKEISKLVEVKFVYSAQKIPAHKKVSFQAIDQKVKEILDQLLGPLDVLYYVSGNEVVLMQRGEADDLLLKLKSIADDRQTITKDLFYRAITGKITNADGEPLQGVSVSVKGTSRGTVTNTQGVFTID